MSVAFTVELLLNGAWVDITPDVRLASGVAVKFGVTSESGTADPATCSLVVNNRDGKYSPRNTAGPYFGHLTRNTPLRFHVGTAPRFYGEVSEFPVRWGLAGTDVWVPLVASGVLRRMVRANAIRSPLATGVAGLGASLTGYWSMEDGGSPFASSAAGATPLTPWGTPQYRTIPLGPASDLVAGFDRSGAWGYARSSPSADFFVGFYLSVPSDGTVPDAILLQFTTPGTAATWRITYTGGPTAGYLKLQVYNPAGTLIHTVTSLLTGSLPEGVNGRPMFCRLRAQNSGADMSLHWRVRADTPGQYTSSDGWESAGGYTVPGANVTGSPELVWVTPDQAALGAVGIGHVIIGDSYTFLGDTTGTPSASLLLTSYDRETAQARMTRVAALAGVPFSWVVTGQSAELMGPQGEGTPLDVLREVEAADVGGILHDRIDALGLMFRSRGARYSGTQALLTLTYGSGHLSPPLEPTDDDANIRNDVTVTRAGGATARAIDTTSTVNALDYPAGIGAYPYGVTLNLGTDAHVPQVAGWLLNVGTVDKTRYPQLTVDLIRNPTLVSSVNAVTPGSRVRVTGLPAWVGDTAVDLHAIGWTEVVDSHARTLTFNCVPAPPFHVVKLDDATFGTLDTTNRLAL